MTQSSSNPPSDTYYLGLTMAGAISAGAYTAGVIDVLLEALDRHNARYQAGKAVGWTGDLADHPRHRVVLRVISGTSAGGVTAGLMVAGLIGARRAEDSPDGLQITEGGTGDHVSPDGYAYTYSYTLKPLHEIWVEALDLWRPADRDGFLSTTDLKVQPVVSALNSGHIDAAATAALRGIAWSGGSYGFLAEDLDLFLTTTNLQGVPYKVGFPGSDDESDGTGRPAKNSHAMAQHSTVRHFRLSGLGVGAHSSPWLEAWQDMGIALRPEPGKTIDFEFAEDIDDDALGRPWPRFKMAAIATGAFPVGLAPRIIRAEASDLGLPDSDGKTTGGAWPINLMPSPETRPLPALSDEISFVSVDRATTKTTQHREPAIYVAADGGVANNEPFELARYTLRQTIDGRDVESFEGGEKFLASNPRDPEKATASVLMIDPFPEGPVYQPLGIRQANALAAMIPAAGKLLPALINQARFKPGELIEAANREVFSRFLISPSRKAPELDAGAPAADGARPPKMLGAKAIASGSFGGFGGFFDRSFRAHDYMLGKRNAQRFIQKRLLIGRTNPILNLDPPGEDAPKTLPVIQPGQDFFDAAIPSPPWPRMSQGRLDPILDQAEIRVRDVGGALLKFSEMSWFRKLVLGTVWGGLGPVVSGIEAAVSGSLRSTVLAELIGRDQHHDFRTLADPNAVNMSLDLQRRVLVALAEAGREPIPLALPESEYQAARARGERPRDLLHVVLNEIDPDLENRAFKLDNLRRFLRDPAIRDHVWEAPWRTEADARYTLAALKPAMSWKHNFWALKDRVLNAPT